MTSVHLDEICRQNGSTLRSSLQEFYNSLFMTPFVVQESFDPSYVQYANGETLEYPKFLQHIEHVRKTAKIIRYTVVDAIAYEGTIADRHMVSVETHDGSTATLEVLCLMHVKNGKIVQVNEMSRLANGEPALSSLATATE